MSTSFDLPETDHLTTGAIGPPGQRVFYLQAGWSGNVVTLRLEKTQVAALCRYLDTMLADLRPPGPLPTNLELIEPVVAEWVVGAMGVTYDEESDRVLVVAEEAQIDTGEEGEEGDPDVPPDVLADIASPARARFGASREQIAALARHGTTIVSSGRPPCPLCGGPLDPEGHMCVRTNGHRGPTA